MNSPAETITTSPVRSLELGTFSSSPISSNRLATVSERALRSVSACAFPRPSAIASAKLAKSTVNHSHSVICRLNLKPAWPCSASRTSSTVVMTLPTSTTNMTGLPIICFGLSFTIESQSARRTIFHSQTALDFVAIIRVSESLACSHQQTLENWSQAECWKEGQRADNDDHACKKNGEKWCRNRESSE